MKKIGVVIPSPINYSETFLYSKLKGLIGSDYKIIIYCKSDTIYFPEFKHIFQWALSTSNLIRSIQVLFGIIRLLIFAPLTTMKLIYINKISGVSLFETIQQLYINGHILSGNKLDVLHFEFATIGVRRENVARSIGAKLTLSFRGFDIGLYPHQNPSCYDILWKKIDKVHTISDDLYHKAINLGLDPKIPYKKITPAINTEFFKSNNDKKLHNPLRILTVGRLTWKKGYEYALKALVLLKNEDINFEYHIVGGGDYREAIMYSIHQLGLTKNVSLIGQMPHDEVKNEMDWADIYIQPSIQEGFCNAVLEAQAMKLLCIVTNAEGLSENVLDGKTGWVIPKRSSDKLAEKIIDISSKDSKELNKIRESAVNRVKKRFNLEIQNKQFREFYN